MEAMEVYGSYEAQVKDISREIKTYFLLILKKILYQLSIH